MSAASTCDSASLGSPSTLHSHPKRVRCVAPSGSERVVSVSDDNSIVVWDLGSDKEECHWVHNGAMSVAVSHDGKYVVSGSCNGDLQVCDVESGYNSSGPWRVHEDKVWSVTWSPDGSRIASCSEDGTFIIWNASRDLSTGDHFLKRISAEQNAVYTIAYCPTGTKLATGGLDSTIKIWDAGTGLLQIALDSHAMSVSSVALTKDVLISGSPGHNAQVWDISEAENNTVKAVFISDSDSIKHIAVSKHFFATASYNDISLRSLTTYEPHVASFKFPKGDELGDEFPKGDEPNCIALSADEKTMIVGTEKGKVYIWNIGGDTSTLIDNDHIDLPPLDNGNNLYVDGFLRDNNPHESGPLQSQSGRGLLVDKARKFIHRVAAMRLPPVSSPVTSHRSLRKPRRRSANGTNDTTHPPHKLPVANIEGSCQDVVEGHSQATFTPGPTQLPSPETPRERAGLWATVKATVRATVRATVQRLSIFRRS